MLRLAPSPPIDPPARGTCGTRLPSSSPDVNVELLRQGLNAGVDFSEGDGPVVDWVALAEHVVVDTVEHENVQGGLLL